MRSLQTRFLICGVLAFSLFASSPARAQGEDPCAPLADASTIDASDILDCLRAGQAVEIDGAEINGDLDLTSLQGASQTSVVVAASVAISNSHFTGSLKAMDWDREVNVLFKEPVDFSGSRFDGTANFSNTAFEEFANFSGVQFGDSADFTQTTFGKGALFDRAIFNHSADFFNTQFSGGADFSVAQFKENANFMRSHFAPGADTIFIQTQFYGKAYFIGAEFGAPALFNDAKFQRKNPQDQVSFWNAKFTKVNLAGAQFEDGQLELSGGDYELIMPNFHPRILSSNTDMKTYTFLEQNFPDQKNGLRIANEIAYWRHRVQREEKPTLFQALEIFFLDWTFGYGLKPLRSVAASIVLILFFAIFYYPAGVLRPAKLAPSKPRERGWSFRLSALPIADDEDSQVETEKNKPARQLPPRLAQVWQAILFSFSVFTKISSSRQEAVRARRIVITEWIVGLIVMAGFLYSLANTNPLVRTLFNIF